ncbi:plasmid partitioning protein RepB [Rhizobium sp. PP-CC-3G-465]|uniref:plasmid partitioning protein RepB n=1 Tax=Rhizobium sp. PP-CC-3G-465 TaxID=2135648 RepID=UPI0010EC6FEF|nr:ParB family chromosome partitioning protein [Rhizobium sp. PP-CC-3G-465]
MSRKGIFDHLSDADDGLSLPTKPLMKPKSMAAVSESIGNLNDRTRRADEIEKRLAEGQVVVDLDASEIDASFAQDRMPGGIDGLKASIVEQGQQVPILVRPHPEMPGRYQVAFGHRRHRALKELGLAVKAIVRDLTDEQLVIAQGQENNERQDLSFIEKARFAATLRHRFPRDVIVSSLSVDKSTLSKMLMLVDALPLDLIEAIGPAPSIGRPSWQQLAELMEKVSSSKDATSYAQSDAVQATPSDERFKLVVAHLKPARPQRGAPDVLVTSGGERLAQMKQNKIKMEITIDKKATPDFAAFIVEHLPALYEAHRAAKQKQGA